MSSVSLNRNEILTIVRNEIIKKYMLETGIGFVPVSVSNRHIHLNRNDINRLFGSGYQLKLMKYLSQPGQFACFETVTVAGPKGKIEGVRILGPERDKTQIELSITDCYRTGIKPEVRMSGDINGTPGCEIIGPSGKISIENGVIVAARHLHISKEEAAAFGLKNGDTISVSKNGGRKIIFENVAVRCSENFCLDLHIDTDEANAAEISNGNLLEIIRN